MTPKHSIRCAIYTRKSTEEGLEQDFNSLDAQREACMAYIASQKAEGWIALPTHYDDGGFSGGTLDRPALKHLLKAIENGMVDVIVVYKIDRLSRSLMDFAKLVEVFDRKGVTFVSVTQSFNTTTSMGRLTLNILLSFAQFEREVTGERIRDKIAASKKRGIWMGGNPPLGYDVANRKLVVNGVEAEIVRLIFQQYLELGCARLLCLDLAKRGIVSKRRIFQNGETRGGKPIGRSALYATLKNRIYVGETMHKGVSYPGEHEAIISRSLFDVVQARLEALAPSSSGRARIPNEAPYAGLLFDETGATMLPTFTVKRRGLRYRYYVSRPALKGQKSEAAISRISAPPFEAFIANILVRLDLSVNQAIPTVLRRIEILSNSIIMRFDREEIISAWQAEELEASRKSEQDIIDHYRNLLASGETIRNDGGQLVLTLPVRARFHGGHVRIIGFTDRKEVHLLHPDIALIKATARAHRWRKMLLTGEINSIEALAKRCGLDRGYVAQILKLGFLSPSLTQAIIQGKQLPTLRLSHLFATEIALSWREQSVIFSRLGP
jgi:site-specific DNA recombinase